MNPAGDGLMAPAAHHELRGRESPYQNASPENCGTSRAFLAPPPRPSLRKALTLRLFSTSARIDSAASGRGSLAQRRSASQHARPARRTVPSCTRRAGLLANRNVALGLLAPAAQTHVPRSVAASFLLEAPHRRFPALRIEMAFRSADRLSRETSKTGLRPVGLLLVELLPTGLRPVASSSNTGNVRGRSVLLAIDHHWPSRLDMVTLRLRIVGAPTLCDARPLLPWPPQGSLTPKCHLPLSSGTRLSRPFSHTLRAVPGSSARIRTRSRCESSTSHDLRRSSPASVALIDHGSRGSLAPVSTPGPRGDPFPAAVTARASCPPEPPARFNPFLTRTPLFALDKLGGRRDHRITKQRRDTHGGTTHVVGQPGFGERPPRRRFSPCLGHSTRTCATPQQRVAADKRASPARG
jgi:hypothetical protein